MIKLCILSNPFNVHDREIVNTEYIAIQNLHTYLINENSIFEDEEYKVSVNGILVDNPADYYLQDNDIVVACVVIGKGGGKNILGIIGALALAAVSFGVGGVASGLAWGAAASSWTTLGYVAAMAVMYVGGTLLSHVNSNVDVDVDTDFEQSATYSWNGASTHAAQGTPIPMTFGKVKVTNNNVLCSHIRANGDQQYLNMIVCSGEGPIDSITDIRIDDNPISNYTDVEYQVRLGVNEQEPVSIPSFADEYSDQSLNYELTTGDWRTQALVGNSYSAAELTIELPQGLYYANDEGGLSGTGLTVKCEMREINGTWQEFNGDYIHAATNNAVRRIFRAEGLQVGVSYEFRVRVTQRDGSSSRYGNRAYWTQLSGIVTDDFAYPNLAYVAIKALATSQLSGSSPMITWIQERSKVWVYNPHTEQYEQKPATNAAWACYDLLHLCRRLKNINTNQYEFVVRGCPHELISYDDFAAWANACDDRNLECNYYFDAQQNLENAFKVFEAAGRGKLVRRGTKYGCIYDRASSPVQMFTMGNIVSGTFTEDFLPVTDRANAVEITFNNAEKNYERDTIIIYSDEYDNDNTTLAPTQLTLDAITSAEQAYREGVYYLNKNKYLLRTVTFDADVDAVSCELGDVILISHDLPSWSKSGRLEATTANTVVLDQEVTLETGKTYKLTARKNNGDIVTVNVTGNGTTAELNVANSFEPDNVYSFTQQEISTKPFTIISLQRTADTVITISALEYNEAVYEELETIPEIEYVDNNESLSLTLTEQENGNIYAQWTSGVQVLKYDVFATADGINWKKIGETPDCAYILEGLTPATVYTVKIVAVNAAGKRYTATQTITVTNSAGMISKVPADVINLEYTKNKDTIKLSWDASLQDLNTSSFRGYAIFAKRTSTTTAPVIEDITKDAILVDVVNTNSYIFEPNKFLTNICSVDDDGNIIFGGPNKAFCWSTDDDGNLIISDNPNDYIESGFYYDEDGNIRLFDDETSVNVDGVYHFYVYRLNVDGKKSENPAYTYTAYAKACAQITNVTAGYEVNNKTENYYADVTLDIQPSAYTVSVRMQKGNDFQEQVLLQQGDESTKVIRFNNLSPGTWTVKAITVINDENILDVYDDSTITILDMSVIPDAPDNVNITKLANEIVITWDAVDGADFYEVRTNTSVGINNGLLCKTIDNRCSLTAEQITSRTGTIYVFAHNYANKYSEATGTQFSFTELTAPATNAVDISVSAFTVSVNVTIPADAVGYKVSFTGSGNNPPVFNINSTSAASTISLPADIYTISVCYYDLFGNGAANTSIPNITINPQFDESYIADGAISIEKIDQTVADAIEAAGDKADEIIVNLSKAPGESGYSAITQLNNAINLRVEKDDIINQINLTEQGTTIQGKYLHVDADTQFDKPITASMIQAGAITADKLSGEVITLGNGQGIKGGAVQLDANGLTVTANDGSRVVFNANGMNMYSTASALIGQVGRVVAGTVANGKTVTFSQAWDSVPIVLMSPYSLVTNPAGYSSSNVSMECYAANVSKNGFSCVCRSILGAGSSASIVSGVSAFSNTSKSNTSGTYTFTGIPSTVTSGTMSITMHSTGANYQGQTLSFGNYHYGCKLTVYVRVNGSNVKTFSCGNNAYGASDATNTQSFTISFAAGATISIYTVKEVYYYEYAGTASRAFYPNDYVTINSFSCAVTSPQVLSTGTANFIAIERQTATWSSN